MYPLQKQKEVIIVDRKKMFIAVVSVAVAFCAVACVAAASWTSSTPLYTFRMEQASSEMNFLPTEINNFTYTTEAGSTLNYEITRYCYVNPLEEPTVPVTCPETCEETCSTCYSTCEPTCEEPSCWNTCSSTCSTCKPCSTYRDCP